MKNIFKYIVSSMLCFFARLVIRRYRPKIVMITGSVGKTSTKDAVAAVLTARFNVGKSEKSFNSEFGVPFTIFGVGNPWRNPFLWFSIVKRILALLFLPNHYPNMLVLETGADKPGDLARILRIATPDAVVVTRLPDISVHVEVYASPEAVQEEEFSPAYALPAAAPLIIPADDAYAVRHAMQIPAKIYSYGDAKDADVRIEETDFYTEEGKVVGMGAKIFLAGEGRQVVVKGSVGMTQVLPAAAALALAHAFAISTDDALKALLDYEPPAGRGRLLAGISGSVLIDDSYNASPAAVEQALATLKVFPGAKRRIAVLGDMLELGRYSVAEHERIAGIAGKSADLVVAVGIRSTVFATKTDKTKVLLFNTAREAAEALSSIVREGDVVLVKGSQSIRTERVVEALLADKSDVTKIVRQDKAWKRRE
jgi:UDP-N-acetylmuramoyl-tripeptide--D-alanyl-D-alanine ligase